MQFSSQWKSLFSPGDRGRGREYFECGLVRAMRVSSAGWLTAKVDGSRSYRVRIKIDGADESGSLSCSCPRFEDGFNCKHLWATILEYEHETGQSKTPNAASTAAAEDSSPPLKPAKQRKPKNPGKPAPAWEALLDGKAEIPRRPDIDPEQVELLYVLDAGSPDIRSSCFPVRVLRRQKKPGGDWGRPRLIETLSSVQTLDPLDDDIIQSLQAPRVVRGEWEDFMWRLEEPDDDEMRISDLRLRDAEAVTMLLGSRRLFWTLNNDDFALESLHPIESLDFESVYTIRAKVTEVPKPQGTGELSFFVERNGKPFDEEQIVTFAADGLGITTAGLIVIDNPGTLLLWRDAKAAPAIQIKKSERGDFLEHYSRSGRAAPIELPSSWNVKTAPADPKGQLRLHHQEWGDFDVAVRFSYGDRDFSVSDQRTSVFDRTSNQWFHRNIRAEQQLLDSLSDFPHRAYSHRHQFSVRKSDLVEMVDQLGKDWEIFLHEKRIRQAGEFDISVESGQDWFDLSIDLKFDGESIPLPSLLAAIADKEHFVTLADGSRGRIPKQVLERYARIAEFGETQDDKIRFRPTQAMLLDAMLSSQPNVRVDKAFQSICKKMKTFRGIKPKKPTRTFQGDLRNYQQDGLGWMAFLRDFGLGGCLADDMGLGKTIQVLALLESRRTRRVQAEPKAKHQRQEKRHAALRKDQERRETSRRNR